MINPVSKFPRLTTAILLVLSHHASVYAYVEPETVINPAPIVIGHRGAPGYLPEHTLEGYALAIQMGADYIEPDLVLTKDGKLVARHEPMIGSTTDVGNHPEFANRKTKRMVDGVEYNDWFASDFTLEELKTLRTKQSNAGREQKYNGLYQIPTLNEVIALAKQKSQEQQRTIGIYPEIKHSTYHADLKDKNNKKIFGRYFFEKQLLKVLHKAYGNSADVPVFIQSFEVNNLQYLNHYTDIKLIQLIDADDVKDDGSMSLVAPYKQPYDFVTSFNPHTFADLLTEAGLDFVKTYADGIGPWKPYLVKTVADGVDRNGDGKININDRRVEGSTGVVEMAHDKGLLVHTWTFRNDSSGYGSGDPKAEMAYYFDLGVDGLFTDFTDTGIAARELVASHNAAFPNGIASGDVTQNSAVLWARSASTGNVRFQVMDNYKPIFEQTVTVSNPLVPAKLQVKNLTAGKQYSYRVTSPEGKSLNGSFKTAQAVGSVKDGLSFGVTGDWRGELAPYPAISNVYGNSLDFFVKLGDTIYADYPSAAVKQQAVSLDDYRRKHEEVYASHRGVNSFAHLQRSVATFATIDDHEVINDFAGAAPASNDKRFNAISGLINQTPLYSNGIQAFMEYNALNAISYDAKADDVFHARPDLYRAQRFGATAGLFILDARSFRDQSLDDIKDTSNPLEAVGFLAKSFDATQAGNSRTMLGKRQLERLKADLLAAQKDQVVWKFIVIPEPIQNLGVFLAADRYEGYAAERSEILGFIDDNAIKNVVFISADIHGTVINDLTYQRRADVMAALGRGANPFAVPQIKTSAFEITTGSVAFDPTFGDTVLELFGSTTAGQATVNGILQAAAVKDLDSFNALPMANKNAAFQGLMDLSLQSQSYTPTGLQDNNRLQATLLQGSNVALFSFGWSKFDIAPKTHELKITTYGIAPVYAKSGVLKSEGSEESKKTQVISQLMVKPQR